MGSIAQLTRSHEWWDHKTPQILALAYAVALLGDVSMFHLLGSAFPIIFGSLVLIAIYASIINDFTDLEIDIACGKSNLMQRMSLPVRWLLSMGSLSLVIAAAYLIYPRTYAVVFYSCIAISISLYSFPPIRLKNKGIWGVISCAAAEHMFPTLFAVSVILYFSNHEISLEWLVPAGLLSFLYGTRSILWHQFLDKNNDLKSGINTYASSKDPGSLGTSSKIIIIIELLSVAVIVAMLNLSAVYVAAGLYLIFIFWREAQFKSKIILIITPQHHQHFQILMLDFYTIFFPLSLLIYAAWTQQYGWVVLTIHVVLFYKIIWVTVKDAYYLFVHTSIRLLR